MGFGGELGSAGDVWAEGAGPIIIGSLTDAGMGGNDDRAASDDETSELTEPEGCSDGKCKEGTVGSILTD